MSSEYDALLAAVQPSEYDALLTAVEPEPAQTSTASEYDALLNPEALSIGERSMDLVRRAPASIAEGTADSATGLLQFLDDVSSELTRPVMLKGKPFSEANAAEYQMLQDDLNELYDEQARNVEGGGGAPDPREVRIRNRMRELEVDPTAKRSLESAAQFFRDVSSRSKSDYGVNPALDNTLPAQIVGAAGSIVPAIASGPAAPATIAGMMAEQGRRDAEEHGGTPEQQRQAFYLNAGVGALSEALLGVPALLRSAKASGISPKSFAELVKAATWQAAKSAPREGVQEGIEQTAQNIIANSLVQYDPNRDTFDGVPRAAFIGALVGGPVGAAVQTAQDLPSVMEARKQALQAATAKLEEAQMPVTAQVLESLDTNLQQQAEAQQSERQPVTINGQPVGNLTPNPNDETSATETSAANPTDVANDFAKLTGAVESEERRLTPEERQQVDDAKKAFRAGLRFGDVVEVTSQHPQPDGSLKTETVRYTVGEENGRLIATDHRGRSSGLEPDSGQHFFNNLRATVEGGQVVTRSIRINPDENAELEAGTEGSSGSLDIAAPAAVTGTPNPETPPSIPGTETTPAETPSAEVPVIQSEEPLSVRQESSENDNPPDNYGGRLRIRKAPGLDEEQRTVEAKFAQRIESDLEGAKAEYWRKFGNVIDRDRARELAPEYSRDRESRQRFSEATLNPSGVLVDELYRDTLNTPDTEGRDIITFSGGSAGVGKSTFVDGNPIVRAQSKMVVDGTLQDTAKSLVRVQQALDSGHAVQIFYIDRNFEESIGKIIDRAADESNGRIVNARGAARARHGAIRTILALHEKFGGRPDFGIFVIDNTGDQGRTSSVSELQRQADESLDSLRQRAKAALDGYYAQRAAEDPGRYTPELYKALGGAASGIPQISGGSASGGNRGTELGGATKSSGDQAGLQGAVSETGSVVPPPDNPAAAPETTSPNQSPTGIRNAIVDEERVKRGLPPRIAPLRKSFGATWDQAMARIDSDPQIGPQLVAELAENPRPATDVENAVLTHESLMRRHEFDRAIEAQNNANTEAEQMDAAARLDRARDAYDAITRVTASIGTEQGRALASRKLTIIDDFSLAEMEASVRSIVNNGKPLTPKQAADVKAAYDKITELEKRLAEFEERERNTAAQHTFENLIKELRDEARTQAKEGRRLTDFLDDQAKKARARIAARRGKLMTTLDPLNVAGLIDETIIGASYIAKGVTKFADWSTRMLGDIGNSIRPVLEDLFRQSQEYHDANAKLFGGGDQKGRSKKPVTPAEVLANAKAGDQLDPKLVFDLARAHVRAGVEGMENVMNRVHQDLLPMHDGLTVRDVRDAFSGYGKVQYPSKQADLVKLREYRTLARLASQLEDALKGIAPLKTGPQRDKASEKVRTLQKQVADAMRRFGIQTTSPEQQLKTSLDAVKSRLRNEIEELDAAIKNRQPRPANKSALEYDAEAKKLKEQRDAKKKEYDSIFDDTKHREQQALDAAITAAKRSISRYDEMFRTGNLRLAEKASGFTPTSELEDLQMLRDSMRSAMEELRRAEIPRKPEEQRNAERAIKSLEKSIAQLDRRMLEGDFSPGAKKVNRPEVQRVAELREIRDQMRETYNEMRRAQLPKRSPEEVQLARAKKALETRIKKLQEKIARNDYTMPPKKDPVMDDEKRRLQYDLAKVKEQYTKGLFEAKLKQQTKGERALRMLLQGSGLLRALNTAIDLGMILRQGKRDILRSLTSPSYAAHVARRIGPLWDAIKTEQGAHAAMQRLKERENYPLYKMADLAIVEEGEMDLKKLEEQYQTTWTREGIPVPFTEKRLRIPGLAASERAYTTWMNIARADLFDAMAQTMSDTGKITLDEAKVIANGINISTGRGDVGKGKFAQAVPFLNSFLFATRFYVSRIQTLTLQPLWGGKLAGTGRARKVLAMEYLRAATGMAIWYGLLAGVMAALKDDDDKMKVGLNPFGSEFGKIKIGKKTTIDPFAGLQQFFVFFNRMIFGKTVNNQGKTVPIRGDKMKYGKRDADDVIRSFVESKRSPIAAAIHDAIRQEHYGGRLWTPASAAMQFAPMSPASIVEILKEHSDPLGVVLSALSFGGEGVQVYDEKKKR